MDDSEASLNPPASVSPGPAGPPPFLDLPGPFGQPSEVSRAATPAGLPDWLDLLRNRFILAGLGGLVVLALIAIVLVAFGRDDGSPGRRSAVVPGVADGGSEDTTSDGIVGLTRITATMRNGPDSTYSILGTIPRGARVPVIGRNADDTWLQITYPPGSELQGWVSANSLDVSGDVSQLVIAGPGSGPSVAVPTSQFPFVQPTSEEPAVVEPTRTPYVRPTSRPTPLPRPTRTPRPTITPQFPPPTRVPPTPTPATGGDPVPTDAPEGGASKPTATNDSHAP